MRVGIQLPEVERRIGWPELRLMAENVERLGFDSIWVGDHLLYEEDGRRSGPWEAWSQLAALAAVTERVALGPLVAVPAFHQPAVLAKTVATVDEISAGRLILGLGAGWNETEFRAFGLPFDRRLSRFAEAFEIIRRLLAGERFDYRGEFYRLEGCELLPRPSRSGGPPVMIGSIGPRMIRLALPHAAAWNVWFEHYGNDPDRLPAVMAEVERACHEVGRDPGTLERTAAHLLQFGPVPSRRTSVNPTTGPPAAMAAVLERLAAAGVDHVQLVLDPITVDTIERTGEVLGKLRGRV